MSAPPTVSDQRILGSIFHWQNLKLLLNGGILDRLVKWRNEFGDLVRIRIGPEWVYLVSRPEDIAKVLVENHKNFSKDTPGYRGLRSYLGNGLLSTNTTSRWERNRRAIQPLFLREQVVKM